MLLDRDELERMATANQQYMDRVLKKAKEAIDDFAKYAKAKGVPKSRIAKLMSMTITKKPETK